MLEFEKTKNSLFKFTETDIKNIKLPAQTEWQSEKIFGINKERGHATYIPYVSTDKLQADARYQKAWLTSKTRNSFRSTENGSSNMRLMLPSATPRL